MPNYQPNVPTGSVPFDQDYLNLQGNFQQLDIAYGYDHVPFSNTSGLPPSGQSGLHEVIHMLANTTLVTNPPFNYPINPPTPVLLTGEIFTTQSNDGYDSDTILWYQSEKGKVTQLTRNFTPQDSAIGATYLPGGLTLNWGIGTEVTDGVVGFTQPYKSGVYSVVVTVLENNNNRHFVFVKSTSLTNFTVVSRDSSGSDESNTFTWMAIGK